MGGRPGGTGAVEGPAGRAEGPGHATDRDPRKLRAAFADVGRRLPELWERLPVEARKTMLRALVAGVNLDRDANGVVRMRIVWSGGLVTETSFAVAMSSFRMTEREGQIVERIRRAVEEGQDDATIAESLNPKACSPCRDSSFTPAIVGKLRRRHRHLDGPGEGFAGASGAGLHGPRDGRADRDRPILDLPRYQPR